MSAACPNATLASAPESRTGGAGAKARTPHRTPRARLVDEFERARSEQRRLRFRRRDVGGGHDDPGVRPTRIHTDIVQAPVAERPAARLSQQLDRRGRRAADVDGRGGFRRIAAHLRGVRERSAGSPLLGGPVERCIVLQRLRRRQRAAAAAFAQNLNRG